MNMTKENVIANVQSSLGSLFTKDDVIACLQMVETPQPQPQQDFRNILSMVQDRVVDAINGHHWNDSSSVEVENIEYTIRNGNEIEIESLDVDANQLRRDLLDGIEDLFNDLWAEHQMRTEIVNENN